MISSKWFLESLCQASGARLRWQECHRGTQECVRHVKRPKSSPGFSL